MAVAEDLINFDLIETQKENIQSLPQGRSAKALATAFGATPFSPVPTPGSTRNLNDAIRSEYEKEIQHISDSDDPLDIYDRYVKWTLNAYPSAQATPESQLRPLLERATKAFQSYSNYKNDPRYLKLWIHYIRFFSDAPRETFAYLSRHNIGEGLALFYEEFAAWLEGAERWNQAEEVYKMGIEREARPTERLLRKFGEFQTRYQKRPLIVDEPSSPALPTLRPALAAKVDPFASSSSRQMDPQSQRLSSSAGSSRVGKSKLTVFADTDASSSAARPTSQDISKGWNSIGSISERKKENTIEARPWVGETLKTAKRAGTGAKIMVFKDESHAQVDTARVQRTTTNPRTGRVEHCFANLHAVYPNSKDLNEEYSFEELRSRHRGWSTKVWAPDSAISCNTSQVTEDATTYPSSQQEITHDLTAGDFTTMDFTIGGTEKPRKHSTRPRRKKIVEVKAETQTVKLNLDSPTGRKVKRKSTAEPTMTLHTKAANEEMLDIFNQPLGQVSGLGNAPDSADESEYDTDDYTSGGESTGTGHISTATSDCGDDERSIQSTQSTQHNVLDSSGPHSASEWSEFTKSKHVPAQNSGNSEKSHDETQADFYTGLENISETHENDENSQKWVESAARLPEILPEELQPGLSTLKCSPEEEKLLERLEGATALTKLVDVEPECPNRPPLPIPDPPEDFHVPTHPYRDPEQVAQSRLPFMTPIVERTECSFPSIKADAVYFGTKTPSRRRSDVDNTLPQIDDLLLSSPFQDVVNGERPVSIGANTSASKDGRSDTSAVIIQDELCSPLDPVIRSKILSSAESFLAQISVYHDYRPMALNKAAELRKFSKSMKALKPGEKTPPAFPKLVFPDDRQLSVKCELGRGGFAPVYLGSLDNAPQELLKVEDACSDVAVKVEEPSNAWEFYLMILAHQRLAGDRASASLALPLGLELFSDESCMSESFHDQGTILDLSNLSKADAATTGGAGLLDEVIAMFFAAELLQAISRLHWHGILHGDIKADNCLVRLSAVRESEWSSLYFADGSGGWESKGLTLIDFGRAVDTRAFSASAQFLADWPPDKHDCPAVRHARPWTIQPDYWGAAGVIHLLLFGKWLEDVEEALSMTATVVPGDTATSSPLEPALDHQDLYEASRAASAALDARPAAASARRYKLRDAFKRYWATNLWARVFDVLMNPPVDANVRAAALDDIIVALQEHLVAHAERKGLKAGLRRIEERIKHERRRR